MDVRGVDFSGGAEPGTDIWIAEGRLDGGVLELGACRPAAEAIQMSVPGSAPPLKSTPRTSIQRVSADGSKRRGFDYRLVPTAGHAENPRGHVYRRGV